jgi:hypothetical protein
VDNELLVNGVFADTGTLLRDPRDSAGIWLARNQIASPEDVVIGRKRARSMLRGVSPETDANDLASSGWGILFPADLDTIAIEDALDPLIKRRQSQAGGLFKIFKEGAGWQTGESASDWLDRQGPRLDVVNPRAGVPYYLMIVGSPDVLPMSFQYSLDIFWAVGRLYFSTISEYARYARSVVDYETLIKPPQSHKRLALFAPEHPFDAATRMFTAGVARPFVNGDPQQDPLGKNQNFKLDTMLGNEATKDGLANLLRRQSKCGSPALLFSGSHGMVFRPDDKRLPGCQGAIVCQDWKGFGQIDESAWFSAADIPRDASLLGMIHFMFACYSGGWERFDTFRTEPDGTASQIAPTASMSRLPQAMLGHPNGGALAVIAHIDRAWNYSFTSGKGNSQSTGMRDVLTGIMMGTRLGHAMDQFTVRWAALSVGIADAIRDFGQKRITSADLARQWIIRDDARNYILFGDPAVRLRVEDMIDNPKDLTPAARLRALRGDV